MSSTIISIDIATENPEWDNAFPAYQTLIQNTLNSAAIHLINNLKYDLQDTEVSVLLANNDKIKMLNSEYRGKDKPTNILSFPMHSEYTQNCLGDLALALDVILSEAKAQNKTPQDHLCHLLVHGFLHLLDYDHINDDEAHEMEALEVKILGELNIKNPYEAQ